MGYNNRTNYLTGNVLSDEWYTPPDIVDKCISLCDISDKTIICPYDTDNSKSGFFSKRRFITVPLPTPDDPEITNNSKFVKRIKKIPHKDIIYGISDFINGNYEYDVCITNPPFSYKREIFEQCLKNKKDFILILPETFIFSVGFYNLYKTYDFRYKLYIPKQRIYFIDENGNQNRPNFHSVIIYVSDTFTENLIYHFEN